MNVRFSCALALAGLALAANRAAAESNRALDDSYFAAKLTLGFAGGNPVNSTSVNVGNSTVSTDASGSGDLGVSFGGALQYMVPLHKYFALGGLFGLLSWKTDADTPGGRNLGLDLGVVPEGRFPLTHDVELYLAVPLGLTLDFWNQVEGQSSVVGNATLASYTLDTKPAVGFMFSALLGVRVAIASSFGLFTELGYSYRTFSHTIRLSNTVLGVTGSVEGSADISVGQLAWNIGAFF